MALLKKLLAFDKAWYEDPMSSWNRRVVLTGAAGGVGRAIAANLAARGARLALVDRQAESLEKLKAELPGGPHTAHHFDLAQIDAISTLVEDVVEAEEGVDVLINNAGCTVHGLFVEQTPEEIEQVMHVNLHAAIRLSQAFLPHLRRATSGHIVNMASLAGLMGFPFQSTYSATKFGLRGFGQALRIELRPEGIGVTTVMPGAIATPFLTHAPSHSLQMSSRMSELMQSHGTSPDRGQHFRRGVVVGHCYHGLHQTQFSVV